jgi:hypothetical protein|nr:MAG TPA: hypothetical protein [Bacteriophage sp.]
MIDFKKTIINLHEKFPEYDLDTLIKIIDAIVETTDYSKFNYPSGVRQPWIDTSKVTCTPESNISYTKNTSDKWIDIISSGVQIRNPHDTIIY